MTAINKHLGWLKRTGCLAALTSWITNRGTQNKKEKTQTFTDLHLLCENPVSSVPSLWGVPEHSGRQLVGLRGFLLHAWALDSWRFSVCWKKRHRNGHLCTCYSYVLSSQLLPCCQPNWWPPSAGLLTAGPIPAKEVEPVLLTFLYEQ